jgi:hypothetical protein
MAQYTHNTTIFTEIHQSKHRTEELRNLTVLYINISRGAYICIWAGRAEEDTKIFQAQCINTNIPTIYSI